MSSRSRSSRPSARELLTEKLHALLDECDQIMSNADFGQPFNDLDDFLFVAGKNFIREVQQHKLQERITLAEAEETNKQCSDCKKKRNTDTNAPKT